MRGDATTAKIPSKPTKGRNRRKRERKEVGDSKYSRERGRKCEPEMQQIVGWEEESRGKT